MQAAAAADHDISDRSDAATATCKAIEAHWLANNSPTSGKSLSCTRPEPTSGQSLSLTAPHKPDEPECKACKGWHRSHTCASNLKPDTEPTSGQSLSCTRPTAAPVQDNNCDACKGKHSAHTCGKARTNGRFTAKAKAPPAIPESDDEEEMEADGAILLIELVLKPMDKLMDSGLKMKTVVAIDAIIDQRSKADIQEFLVRWRGYGEDGDSWEPKENLGDHGELCE